jgi:signal transduction histidine kinase
VAVRTSSVIVRRWLPAAGFGLVLALGALLASISVGSAAADERHDRLGEAADAEAERLIATLERDLAVVEQLTAAADSAATFRRAAAPQIRLIPEIVAVALATRANGGLDVVTAVPSDVGLLRTGEDLATDHELDIVLTRVVEEADAVVGAPFDIDGKQAITVAAPVVTDTAAPEAQRRSSVSGVVTAAVDVDALFGDSWPGPAQLVAPDGRAVGDDADADFGGPIDISGRTWQLRLEAPAAGTVTSQWVVLIVGIILAAIATAVLGRQLDRRRVAEDQASERTRQLTRIADAGARLQQSLDLAEILPAFAVSLAADFDLRTVSIALIDDEGDLVEAFATGDAPGEGSIELPLRRGWRTVGTLSIFPERRLDDAERTSLQALADLLAVALSNAQLYEREQLNAARLKDLDALKNAFLGTVSHELRTSMTAIMGFGELLSDAWDNLDEDRRKEMANRIRRSAGSLRHLVDDLLDFARLEQERLRVAPRSVDLAGIVRQTIDGLSPLLGKHEVDLQLAESVQAWADPIAVERILANLVSNAAKYSPADSTVTVRVEPVGDVARLTVSDQGPGIPADERRRIFARFYRLDTPESVRTRGAGIGLAILRDFADRSGATVGVDDAPGGGACFTVDFPTQPVDLDEHLTMAGT